MINKQSFDTYAFTIDLVPLVLEKSCFAGHVFEYKWKIIKRHNQAKCNADSTTKKQAKAHPINISGPSTNMGMIQAHPVAHNMKSVARGASPGRAAPGVRPHPHHCHLSPSSIGGCMLPCIVGPWWFPKIPTSNQPWISINKRVELTFNTHATIWSIVS
jgi:hypothetical protein